MLLNIARVTATLYAAILLNGCAPQQPANCVRYEGLDVSKYSVVSHRIPAKGRVVRVKMIPDRTYGTEILPDSVKYSGPFEYTIDPENKDGEEINKVLASALANETIYTKKEYTDVRNGSVTLRDTRAMPKLIGFDDTDDLILDEVTIATRGHIVSIEKLSDEKYRWEYVDGNKALKGPFRYRIEPDPKFYFEGMNLPPPESGWWSSDKQGTLVFRMKAC